MLLGSSLASVEIVQTAKEMGCYTIVTDNLDPEYSPAKKEADEYWMISTGDLDTLESKCRENNVNAIFAGVSEFNLDMVKELTTRLDLPCYIEDSAWKYARDKKAFKEKCIAFLKAIGCRKGIAWFQFIRDEEGRYYALEMAQRISADSAGKSAKFAAGVNDLEWMLDVALGKDHSADELPQTLEPPYKNPQCVYYLFADRSGTVSSMQGFDELDKNEFLISVLAHTGSYVDKYRNMVRIVFNARNGKDMCDKLRRINNNIRILDEKGDNMYIQFTDYEEVIQSNTGLFLHK